MIETSGASGAHLFLDLEDITEQQLSLYDPSVEVEVDVDIRRLLGGRECGRECVGALSGLEVGCKGWFCAHIPHTRAHRD